MKKIGLTNEEVQLSKEKYGNNQVTEQETESFLDKLKGNFGDPMIKILCVALIINVIFAFMGKAEWYDSLGIAIAVLLATLVSTYSEYSNENAFQKLQEEASRIMCKVYRNNKVIEISINDIVVGDVVLLQTGDKIPADGKVVEGSIKVDQSVLNGETKEASKVPMPSDYQEEDSAMDFLNTYKVFRGSVVVSGNALMKVTVVGDKSVYGQIASELQIEDERESPLKVKLGKLADDISKFGYIGGIAIAVALLFQRIVVHNGFEIVIIMEYCSSFTNLMKDLTNAVMLAVIIIVMAVPEGLPLMIAIVSALNMSKMLKDNVLVRKIVGIETAGSLNILFSDKTGTITKGKLETVIFVDGNGKETQKYDNIPEKLQEIFSLNVFKNTNALITGEDDNIKIIGGNATERAILGFVGKNTFKCKVDVMGELPFNSENKYSACIVSGDYNTTLVKGAPEKLLSKCRYYYDENGQKHKFNNHDKIEEIINGLANRAIRVLAFATSEKEIHEEDKEIGECTLVGIIGIRDDVRPESVAAIKEVQDAGVQVVMITGDRKDTAIAIAKETGLIQKDTDLVYTSDELATISDETIASQLSNIKVVARALPSDKSRFVKIAQELNLVVGMTGDGVNDSPALKKADVGFGMGGGTEVAKEASDIVILDDNFMSIEKAILYGRTIFNSIRKFIIFQLTINVAAVMISFVAPLLGMENPLSITQILWVNLVMDTLAALAFGGEPALKRFMKEKPKKREENIVSKYMWSSILTGSIWTFILSMLLLLAPQIKSLFRVDIDNKYLLTGYFTFFIFISVFNAFNARTKEINLTDNIFANKGFLKVIFLIVIIQVLMTYLGGAILRSYGLTAKEWLVVLGLAITIIPIDIMRKELIAKSI
ncbi:calcium-translocating P-type ATPase, PMCA-type [Fusobacterium sp. PH5-44]|uniref:calcium-translocating P-type ATPase, PMCA-type n=1 Tax=unclassified Fusobacterium TaxID=2648384 RepID=UPI003D242A27